MVALMVVVCIICFLINPIFGLLVVGIWIGCLVASNTKKVVPVKDAPQNRATRNNWDD